MMTIQPPEAAMPASEVAELPLAVLYVRDEETLAAQAKKLAKNFEQMGVLHDPIVVPEADGIYRVIAGRRRVAAARLIGRERLRCRVYPALSEQQQALMLLSENICRAPAWVEELRAISRLVSERIGMTEAQIAATLGVPVTKIREYIKMAGLPPTLLVTILDGGVSQEVARKMVRLTPAQRERLADALDEGEELTSSLVTDFLHRQISSGALALPMEMPPVSEETGTLGEEHDGRPAAPEGMVATLAGWEQALLGRPGSATALLYLRALKQELQTLTGGF